MTISPSRPLPAPPWETGQPVRMTWTEALAWFDRYRPEVVAVYRRKGRTVAVVRPRKTGGTNLMPKKVYRKIAEIEQSPFNRRYMLVLECGHTVWVSRRPRRETVYCEQCTAQQNTKAKEVNHV